MRAILILFISVSAHAGTPHPVMFEGKDHKSVEVSACDEHVQELRQELIDDAVIHDIVIDNFLELNYGCAFERGE